eukprot:c10055_g1_i1.p1 GENE.c10055_g1_i1~~c10055_g1_i1.p1  ORF type:complete len:483 (+),score=196.43 c10055_g1_i1:33-1451(+)
MVFGDCEEFRFKDTHLIRLGVIRLSRKRPWGSCINPETKNEWKDDMDSEIVKILQKNKGLEVFFTTTRPNDDPSLRIAVQECLDKNCHVVLATQTTISDGRLAPVLSQIWGHSVVFWATPEQQTGSMISGNSLVGTHLSCATLRQLGRECELVYGNLNWSLAEAQLHKSVWVSFATRYLRKSKICLLGYQAPGFVDFHPDPFALSKTFGSILQQATIDEYLALVQEVTEEEVVDDLKELKKLNIPLKDVTDEELPTASRSYLAMKKLIKMNNFDAIAIRCWPEMNQPQNLGQWPYISLARLSSEGFPSACEGDVDGALGCLIAKFLGCGVCYLSDWLEHDDSTLTLWHGGMAPFQLSEAIGSAIGPCFSRHFNTKHSGVIDATIKIGMEITIFRFWVFNSKYHLVIFQGKTISPKRHLMGNNGLVELEDKNMIKSFEKWVQNGFPHHVCVVQGYHKQTFIAFARHFDIVIVE